MNNRIALASSDGIIVDEHFGHCHWFYIVDLNDDGSTSPVERRWVDPACSGGTHSESGLQRVVAALSDCKVVVAVKAGPGAQLALKAAGIRVVERSDIIDDVLKGLL
jgi:predicted Fe-Mo cluster-binding NifX family protein